MTARKRLLVGAGLILGAVAVAVLPFTLMLLPNPGPVRVSTFEQAGTGAFVGSESALFRLFPYAAAAPSFPHGVPSVRTDAQILVRTKSTEDFTSCRLTRFPSGEGVAIAPSTTSGRSARLVPASSLAVGRYVLSSPRGGMYGGTDFYYFRVEATATANR
jgi:hypothetical protein